jgi:PIN domain nuclease of toxin-antitoxin system
VTSVVLDASALMALLRSEPGADQVAKSLKDSVISAVNYSEILKKTKDHRARWRGRAGDRLHPQPLDCDHPLR